MFVSALIAAGSAVLMVSAQTIHQVLVGASAGFPSDTAELGFEPSIVTANVGDIVQFIFADTPDAAGNHSVTQSSFATPCEAIPGGFDSGWVFNDDPNSPAPTWNPTITTSAPVWFYCKQLKSFAGAPHCPLHMVGVINIGAKSFDNFAGAASTATTVVQTEGPLSGVGAFATAAPNVVGPLQSLLNPFATPLSQTASPSSSTQGSHSHSSSAPPSNFRTGNHRRYSRRDGPPFDWRARFMVVDAQTPS
ncbi:hypothetical protein FB45DRAFT_927036 [Roridomyces roridus]|uniref:Extracellular serine-rich protein n=1 Tax=Roridomyces roridus TaxID=1738132 RepID=A0AAD7FIK2_9AGAR|nr:hypothetical protein FB45DRAFT_927036 [Roridomyces roridus]